MSDANPLHLSGQSLGKSRVEVRPTVAELLVQEGVPLSQVEGWIRRRLFSPLSRFCQVAGGSLGLDYGVPEHELVDDFSRARCTDDVIDSLHQYYKIRCSDSFLGRLLRPNKNSVLKQYWRIRSRTDRLAPAGPQLLAQPKK
jgi:hypothetical protein